MNMWLLWLKFLLSFLLSSSVTALPQTEEKLKTNSIHSIEGQLIFAHVIFRHGDRNINQIYPNDPYKDEIHWPEGFGQLTKEGKRQQYRLGQYFRRRYNGLVGNKYSPNEIYVQSTDVERTLMSAQVNLAGLYPPKGDEIWSEDIPSWQPIGVHTIPTKFDYGLYGPEDCPKFWKDYEKYQKESPEVQRIYNKYSNDFWFWSQRCGSNITTIDDVAQLYSTLCIEKRHNKPLPDWAQKAIESNGKMEYIAKFHYKMGSGTIELARLQSGFLIKEMFERFSQKINSTLKPNRSLWLYSAHDLTISYMLNSLGLFELHIPPCTSSLHFELYKASEGEYYVQFFYRKSQEEKLLPMNIPNCGSKCSLDRLYELYDQILPGDHHSECGLER